MNPGGTMLRVYAALKESVTGGAFAPGERLDPKRLATDLLTSTSPVRDALFRLHGEGLVDALPNEGFRQPLIFEPAVRDLYAWSGQLMTIVLRAASSGEASAPRDPAPDDIPYRRRVADCFERIADMSANQEHKRAVGQLLDRSALCRPVEDRLLVGARREVEAIDDAVGQRHWAAARQGLGHFHTRRMRAAARVAAEMRPQTPGSIYIRSTQIL